MKDNQTGEAVVDLDDLEKSFNASLDDLRKSLGLEDEDQEVLPLSKAKSSKKAMDYDDDADDAEESEDDEEEEDEDEEVEVNVKKSLEDELAEDPEAEAAMDVAPFLKALVDAIENRFARMEKSVAAVTSLAKSIGSATVAQMELSKSQTDTVQKIAKQDRKVAGLQRLNKSRFDGDDGPVEVSGTAVLEKSRDWLRTGAIDLTEAGMIEARVNRGSLGTNNDRLDQKVAGLIKKEAS